MSWLQENKFVAGLLGVTLVGAGTLGYLLVTAKSAYEESNTAFTEQTTELNRLKRLPAFPNKDNFEVLEAQRKQYQDSIEELQKQLSTSQLPVEPVTPVLFQDHLKAAVVDFTGAASGKMELPKDFYFGMNVYASTPPTTEAAPLLERQLKALQIIFREMLKDEVSAVEKLDRPQFSEEGGNASKAEAKAAAAKGSAVGKDVVVPIDRQTIDLVMVAPQKVVQKVLNGLVTSKSQMFIPRFVSVENQVRVGPPKTPLVDPNAPVSVDGTPAQPASAPAAPKTPIIVGEEKVSVTARVEIVNVPPPAAPIAATTRGAR